MYLEPLRCALPSGHDGDHETLAIPAPMVDAVASALEAADRHERARDDHEHARADAVVERLDGRRRTKVLAAVLIGLCVLNLAVMAIVSAHWALT